MLRRRIKQNAKKAMAGSWSKAVTLLLFLVGLWLFLTLLEALIHTAMGVQLFEDTLGTPYRYWDDVLHVSPVSISVAAVMALISFFIGAPLHLGVRSWFYALCEGRSDGLLSAFSFFESGARFWRSVRLSLAVAVRKLLFGILFLAPPAALLTLGLTLLPPESKAEALIVTVLLLSGAVLLAVSALLCSIFLNRYFLAPYLVAQGETGVHTAIRRSASYMRGNKVELFVLNISFLPWWLLCITVLPILYAVPYRMASRAMFARWAVQYGLREELRAAAPEEFGAAQAAQAPPPADDMTQEYKFVPRHMLISDDEVQEEP